MRKFALNNLTVIARLVFYLFSAWVYYFDGLHLGLAMRSLVSFIVIADLITWLIYQIYLLPRMASHIGIWAVVNVVVIIFLIKGVRAIWPEPADLQAMAAMVFISVFGIKGMYYFMLELGPGSSS